MGTKVTEQISMEDVIIENPELLDLLEKRQALKEGVSAYRHADKEAKKKIETMTPPPPFRIGRFVIAKSTTQPRSVSFDIEAGDRISIKLVGED